MSLDLIPSTFFRFPAFSSMSPLWSEDDSFFTSNVPSGLSISEDEKSVYFEAAVPGVSAEDIEVTTDKGTLWIKAEDTTEDTNKKYYKKASRSFSYRVSIPSNVDETKNPEATYKNGVMTVTFDKIPESKPKKIEVKSQ